MYPIPPPPPRTVTRHGFTLAELAIVVALLALVALLVIPKLTGVARTASNTVAQADMAAIRDALVGGRDSSIPSLVGDLDGIPGFSPAYLRLANLLCPTNLVGSGDYWLVNDEQRRGERARFASDRGEYNKAFPNDYAAPSAFTNFDAIASRGWRGPYLRTYRPVENADTARSGEFPHPDDRRELGDRTFEERGFFRSSAPTSPYGIPGEPAIGDPWGNPYILQVPPAEAFEDSVSEPERFRYARIVSAGPDGILTTPCFGTASATDRRDCRLAGRRSADTAPRGDDIVLFLSRADLYED